MDAHAAEGFVRLMQQMLDLLINYFYYLILLNKKSLYYIYFANW